MVALLALAVGSKQCGGNGLVKQGAVQGTQGLALFAPGLRQRVARQESIHVGMLMCWPLTIYQRIDRVLRKVVVFIHDFPGLISSALNQVKAYKAQ